MLIKTKIIYFNEDKGKWYVHKQIPPQYEVIGVLMMIWADYWME